MNRGCSQNKTGKRKILQRNFSQNIAVFFCEMRESPQAIAWSYLKLLLIGPFNIISLE
jgi:hypothetical protein